MAEPRESFEAALAALEERVRRLEAGDVALDEALHLFEDGVALARQCHGFLDEAEQRVAALSRGTAGVESTPLPEPD
ncbi:MAG TPA: exodeoxyribonuclease VII small subunit [Myxococcota bacterium]|nr:exodeoxyribonuclease VII small subunit [Myxococcota bacterium]